LTSGTRQVARPAPWSRPTLVPLPATEGEAEGRHHPDKSHDRRDGGQGILADRAADPLQLPSELLRGRLGAVPDGFSEVFGVVPEPVAIVGNRPRQGRRFLLQFGKLVGEARLRVVLPPSFVQPSHV